MKRKNLEKAVVLSLILSTGVCGSAWAVAFDEIENQFVNNKLTITSDTDVDYTDTATDNVVKYWSLAGKEIAVNDNVTLNMKNIALLDANITGNGNIVLEVDNHAITQFLNNGKVQADTLTIKNQGSTGGVQYHAVNVQNNNELVLKVNDLSIDVRFSGVTVSNSKFTADNTDSITIKTMQQYAIQNSGKGSVSMVSDKDNSEINLLSARGIIHSSTNNTYLKAKDITIGASGDVNSKGVETGQNASGNVVLEAVNKVYIGNRYDDNRYKNQYPKYAADVKNGQLLVTAAETEIKGKTGIYTSGDGVSKITATGINEIFAKETALKATGNSITEGSSATANIAVTGQSNLIAANSSIADSKIDVAEQYNFEYGDSLAIAPEGTTLTTVTATGTGENGVNILKGAVSVAKGDSAVEISGANNAIYPAYKLGNSAVAVYSNGAGAKVNINGSGENIIITNKKNTQSEHTVWAEAGGTVNINGTSQITASGWEGYEANNLSSALVAGSKNPQADGAETGVINFDYGSGSVVTGDIVAGYAGSIEIKGQNSGVSTLANGSEAAAENDIAIYGNALAANGGEITMKLGAGSVWQGRADDYQDAADTEWSKTHVDEYAPVFSAGITDAGTVAVELSDGAVWDVMGQSWLSTLSGTDGVVDMRNSDGDNSRAVHIGELSGSHTFVMDLDTEHSVSNMLYVKSKAANSEQKLWVNSINGLDKLQDGEKLRFATVNSNALTFSGDYTFGSYENAKNGIMLLDNGVIDNALIIGSEEYNESETDVNTGYNGNEFTDVKAGNAYVDDNYGNGATNWYLTREKKEDKISDAGKTIINMSRANYKNAVYMDRLNKRMGEARYINGEEADGMWVRLRHDRIGMDGEFRSMNTMYELGYDVKQECDNGERRVGFAVDYMRGKTTYSNIYGKGELDRYGLWLYDTWVGDKGHYADYVAKWGHLSNDFDITAKSTGEKISGDYSNNVFSVSAEYGKKNDLGDSWYFEPQAQLQLARVSGADYVTTQGSKVSVDGINSLIGRAGFRLGRDMDENSTVYVKADLLHEFLGDQTITASDATGTLREEFENEGTWYDIGFGFAAKMSKNSYAFVDFEKSFGNDNDETYQINAGVQWSF